MNIYIVTVVQIGDPIWQWGVLHISCKRTIGWFFTPKDAERAVAKSVRKNIGGVYYDHCVIEEISHGLYPHTNATQEKWFEWVNGRYLSINKPVGLEEKTNFSIG